MSKDMDNTRKSLTGQSWTPCRVRLPDGPSQVLVTVLWHEPYDNYEVTLGEYWEGSEGWGEWKDGEIIAWMELPQPYMENSNAESKED